MRGALALIPIWLTIAAVLAWAAEQPPSRAVTVPCTVTECHDGDTITVELRLPIRVRLLGCWAPELRDQGGPESRDYLRKLALGKRGTLHVPLDGADRSDDVITFGRLLAQLWIDGDTVDVSAQMVSSGHATGEKQRGQ